VDILKQYVGNGPNYCVALHLVKYEGDIKVRIGKIAWVKNFYKSIWILILFVHF
jgi:hypothetical protein